MKSFSVWRGIIALLILFFVLAIPARVSDLHAAGLLRLPLELPLLVILVLALPALRGVVVAALMVTIAFKLANLAIFVAFARPFNLAADMVLIPAGWNWLVRSGGLVLVGAAAMGVLLALALIAVILTWAMTSIARLPRRAGLAAAVSVVILAEGLALLPQTQTLITADTSRLMFDQGAALLRDRTATATFRATLDRDPFATIPNDRLLAALRGNDVLLVFVESYGRVVLDDPTYAMTARPLLDRLGARLKENGFATRSAWITSPTFGGQSWLAHSTLTSGLWINDQRRYADLIGSKTPTLISDFRRAGWRTVAVMPEITMDWPEADFFGFDAVHNGKTLNYAGAPFAYVTMADQFTLAQMQRLELSAAPRPPVMAEIALISSHAPWTPLPKVVPWDQVGDGRIFDTARAGGTPDEVWDDPPRVPIQYGLSIAYVLETLESFVLTYGTDNMVLIVLGDHQPMPYISGENAPRDVPAHIITRNPRILAALDAWAWTPGMVPDTTSPVWPMDSLRARLVGTFTPDTSQGH